MHGRSPDRFALPHWLVIVLVVLTAIFEAHPDGEPQATIGCAYYSTCTPRLLCVYAPILHVRAPVTLLASNLLAPAQTTIGSAHDTRSRASGWAGNR
jgi:hypothetical protein